MKLRTLSLPPLGFYIEQMFFKNNNKKSLILGVKTDKKIEFEEWKPLFFTGDINGS